MARAISLARFENLELRRMLAAGARSIDGTGNNLANPEWGSTAEELLRLAKAAYGDGISTPAGSTRPSAREISNEIVAHGDEEMPNARNMSAFIYAWGQFIDHDLDLTTGASPAEPFNIQVPTGDQYFDPGKTGTQTITLNRSKYDTATGVTTPREQVNDITSFLDGSMVYGSDATRAAALRTFIGGKLATSAGDLLPYNTGGIDNDTPPGNPASFFLAGDRRANENIELTSMHILFMREHNRLADKIAAANPTLLDEQIYQRARQLVIGEIEAITYNEWLPALIGRMLPAYTGYKPWVNPGISNEFSTAAFRLGHSMLEDDVEFLDNNGNATRDEVPLSQAFFNPSLVATEGIDGILKYLASTNAEEIDNKIVDSLRNFLFGPPGAGGFDLASLNIQRGRDHGLADYNTTRAAIGLPRVTSFAQISSDVDAQNSLRTLYGSTNGVDNVDDIDLWVGGLAENHVAGSSVGPTFQRILVDQFTRTRDGDRFWYQINLSDTDRRMVQSTSLADIIARNSGTTNLQGNVFVFNVELSGRVWNDYNGDGRPGWYEYGLGNRVVKLVDDTNTVVQTTTTSRDGRYRFKHVELGDYTIVTDLADGWKFTTAATRDVSVTRGGRIDRLNFGEKRVGSISPAPSPAPWTPAPPPTWIAMSSTQATATTMDSTASTLWSFDWMQPRRQLEGMLH